MENIGEVYLNAHINYCENLTAKTNKTVDVIKGNHQTKKTKVVAGGEATNGFIETRWVKQNKEPVTKT